MTICFDTKVLVHAGADRQTESRHLVAGELVERALRERRGVLVMQVLAEFYAVATRKHDTPSAVAHRYIDRLRVVLPVHAASEADLDRAIIAEQQHGMCFWDALLWATAERVGVRHLLTEDFQDRRTVGRVTFVDPFAEANRPLLDRVVPPPQG